MITLSAGRRLPSVLRVLLVPLATLALLLPLAWSPAQAALMPTVLTPVDGTTLSTPTPTFSGTGETGTTLHLDIDGVTIGFSTTIDGAGHWALTVGTPLADGPHTVAAWAEDVADPSPLSPLVHFTIDTTPPPAPVVVTPGNGTSTASRRPAYGGTAEPNATVTVLVDGASIGTDTADGSGSWTLDQPTDLDDGAHAVRARATDAVGNTSPDSSTSTFMVDGSAPEAPVVLEPTDGATVDDPTPTYVGTSEPQATITLRVDGVVIGTTSADLGGLWTRVQPVALPQGSHTVTAVAADPVGNTSAPSAATTFVVQTTTGPVDQDRDDDGLGNDREVKLGTDPDDPDTDGDRLSDGQEVLGVTIKDRFAVCGRKASRTMKVTSDPRRVDTDKDGVSDGTEVRGYEIAQRVSTPAGWVTIGLTRTDPRARDTDRDGLADGVERSGAANKRWKHRRTDPTRCDTDRGGFSDGQEVRAGSDPTRAASGPRSVR